MRPAATIPGSLFRRVPALLSRLAREERGSAGLELGIGAVVVLTVAALAFDLYSRVGADTATARIAATMADYVSRETAPDGDEIAALGRFLHERELKAPAALVYLISAVRQPPGNHPAETLWYDDTVRIGDAEVTGELVEDCRDRGKAAWRDTLLGEQGDSDDVTLSANDVVIVVEVCARLLAQGTLTSRFVSGNIYRLHALSARDSETLPEQPVYTPADDGEGEGEGETASLDPAHRHSTDRAATAGRRPAAITGVA